MRINILVGAFFILFIALFSYLSLDNITSTPLLEFDGAHRAESAKQMRTHHEYLVPLNGSPFLQNPSLKLQIAQNPPRYLYFHLERPPLVDWLMIISTSLFSPTRLYYVMPSFLFGLSIFGIFFLIIHKLDKKIDTYAFFIALLTLVTSYDWWYISQMSQLDVVFSVFLFLSVAYIVLFQQYKKSILLIFSGLFLGLAILSKGQPAAIMIFPILFLLISKEISLKQSLYLFLPAALIVSVWIIPTGIKFGFTNVFFTFFLNFVNGRLLQEDPTQQAPFFWYARWWIDTLRPGFNLFLLLVVFDFLKRNFNKRQFMLFVYIVCSLVFYSIAQNTVWWYVLPLIPVISLYIYLSLSFHLRKKTISVLQLAIVVIISSLPFVFQSSNTFAILYEIGIFTLTLFILTNKRFFKTNKYIIPFSIFLPLLFFLLHFPAPTPIYPETRDVGRYFSKLTGNKCLYVQDMPYEAALFYSNAGEIKFLYPNTKSPPVCSNYLITPDKLSKYKLIFVKDKIKLYKI